MTHPAQKEPEFFVAISAKSVQNGVFLKATGRISGLTDLIPEGGGVLEVTDWPRKCDWKKK